MGEPEKTLFRHSDSATGESEKQRLEALSVLGLLEAETIPVFEAATQTTADFLEVPICILGFVDDKLHRVRSAVGLSRLGLMNQLATTRVLPRHQSLCTYVVESRQVLMICDALGDPAFTNNILVQHYGIRAYLGAPLLDASGLCLGAIAVMDRSPRNFTVRDVKFLELMACWSMSEFERNWLLQNRQTTASTTNEDSDQLSSIQLKLELLTQLIQELRTPLTSVLGMTSVVSREVYGPLTNKQKEYLEIIQNSGRYLLSLVNEISELGAMDDTIHPLILTSVDIEMLCQQAINTLEESANRREQQIRLSVEPASNRTWILDKDKVRQLLYHLVFSVVQAATTGSAIHIHVSHKDNSLNLAISVSHPWLGEGLTQVDPYFYQSSMPVAAKEQIIGPSSNHSISLTQSQIPQHTFSSNTQESQPISSDYTQFDNSHRRESLRLLLSYHLAQLHGGQITLQGTQESGYRYMVILPQLVAVQESL